MVADKIVAKVYEVQEKFEKAGLTRFHINIGTAKLPPAIAGRASLRDNVVQISEDYIREFEDDIINVTVPHEVCHLYVRKYFPKAKQHHGPEFRRLMRYLGLEGNTYHNMQLQSVPNNRRVKTRFIYNVYGSDERIALTKKQHEQAINGNCRYKGSLITYSGESIKIK